MSLPPLYTRTRASISLSRPHNLPPLNGPDSTLQSPNPKIPILKKDKNLKPELLISKVLNPKPSASPSLEHLKFSGPRASPLNQISPVHSPRVKKSSYLKKNFIDFIQENRCSNISINYTKPIRDYFEISPPVHKSFLETSVKIEEKPKIDRKLTPIDHYKADFRPAEGKKGMETPQRKVVHSKRHPPEAKSSLKKPKIEVSFSRYINESLQTDWNSFVLDEWELDPYA